MGEESGARWTWKRLVWLAPVAMGVVFLLVMVGLAGGFEPALFIFAAILLVTGYVGRRFPRRAGPITVLVVLTVLVLMNSTSIIDDLGHPESFVNFAIFAVTLLAFAIVGIIASVAALRSAAGGAESRVVYTTFSVIVLAIVVSGIATLGLEDDAMEAGDLRVVAEDAEFSTESLTGSGTIGIFIENKDPVRHTFTIEDLDLEVELPGSTDRRLEVMAPAGTYEFICAVVGHESMKGTLTIEG